jgi:hypothetical protein
LVLVALWMLLVARRASTASPSSAVAKVRPVVAGLASLAVAVVLGSALALLAVPALHLVEQPLLAVPVGLIVAAWAALVAALVARSVATATRTT